VGVTDTDLWGDRDDAPVLLRAAPEGHFLVEAKVSLDVAPEGCCQNFVQAGLALYGDDDNYLKLVVVSIWETRQTEFAREVGPPAPREPHYGSSVAGPPGRDWTWLRLAVRRRPEGETVTAWTSRDGADWVRGATWTHDLPGLRLGLVAMGGAGPFTARFEGLRVWAWHDRATARLDRLSCGLDLAQTGWAENGGAGMDPSAVVRFGPFAFDRVRMVLERDGTPVPVGGRGTALLAALVGAQRHVVTRGELLDAVWRGQVVEERNLPVQIAALRKAMGDLPDDENPIRTVSRVGYRLVPDGSPHRAAGILALRPSVAVLPFADLSGDPSLAFFSDGVTEDIIAALSRFRTLAVVGRGTAFAYKGRATPAPEIARALGVRYVLEGSVRRAGRRLRVTAQLVDAEEGALLWADRFEEELDGLFEIQDRIAATVVGLAEPRSRGPSWSGRGASTPGTWTPTTTSCGAPRCSRTWTRGQPSTTGSSAISTARSSSTPISPWPWRGRASRTSSGGRWAGRGRPAWTTSPWRPSFAGGRSRGPATTPWCWPSPPWSGTPSGTTARRPWPFPSARSPSTPTAAPCCASRASSTGSGPTGRAPGRRGGARRG
jgi:TolB-like protein/DNA-binding winged helix-turn-helix (wHTH) protein